MAKDNLETHSITVKPETASHETEQFSWVPLPYCSSPGCPFPIKSLPLSAEVSSQTINFQVLDKSPVSGPGRGSLFLQQMVTLEGLFFAEIDILTTRGTQGPACLPMDQTQRSQLGPFVPGLLLTRTTGQSAPTGKEHRTNKPPPTGRIQERSKEDTTCLTTSQNPSRWHPSWLNKACTTRKDSESE